MNALTILQHAYTSIAQSHPEKDAFQIMADLESLAQRFEAAVEIIDGALPVPVAAQQG